ncbi:hypothetical protein P5673_013672 [Acropora cervicornis]|uniref:Uncharacterized protein n=1 Tax=Acropora cervicornis TaxID=6130 RepID=A0AAD9QLF8_ACRCE|nr:hypothetical protein P5673_013672 [Acropora cervicornis]
MFCFLSKISGRTIGMFSFNHKLRLRSCVFSFFVIFLILAPLQTCCFTGWAIRAQCVAGICVNFVATVFDNSHVIIAIVIVLTFSASVSSFTVLLWFVSCFEIFGVFENSIS